MVFLNDTNINMTNEQYDRARSLLNKTLLSNFPQMKALPFYKNRTDYKKISFIAELTPSGQTDKGIDAIREIGGTEIEYNNAKTISFKFVMPKPPQTMMQRLNSWFDKIRGYEEEVEQFYVKIKLVRTGTIVFNYLYFSYAFHYLIGKLGRSARVYIVENGMYYRYYDGEKVVGNVLITTDFEKILTFFKLDFFRFVKGFNDLDELFDFVTTSPYFRTSEFTRATHSFWMHEKIVEYIERKGLDTTHTAQRIPLEDVAAAFPLVNLLEQAERLKHHREIRVQAGKKFNGKTAMGLIDGLVGDAVRTTMGAFLHSFPTPYDTHAFIVDNDIPTILKKFKEINQL